MRPYRKWLTALGLAAITPTLAWAGPFSFGKKAPAKPHLSRPPLTVAAQSPSSNQAMAEAIAESLRRANLAGYDIEVQCQNGNVQLTGSVATDEQRSAALRAASSVSGVKAVDNKLSVTGQRPPSGPTVTHAQGMTAPGAQPMIQQTGGYYSNGMPQQGMPQQAMPQPGMPYGMSPAMMHAGGPSRPAGYQPAMGGYPSPYLQTRYQEPNPAPGADGMPMNGMPANGMPMGPMGPMNGAPMMNGNGASVQIPPGYGPAGPNGSPAVYDQPNLPNHAWPAYANYPNYANVTYPKQYSATAWPYIGPFYPYPQVPLGWRQVQLEWDDGYWNLNFRPRTERWWWFLDYRNW